jgi:prophage antirepressor-like protein
VTELRDHQKGLQTVKTFGGEQELLCVTEGGLNKLIMRSNKPQAERLQDWLADDVLPTLHHTSSYTMPSTARQDTPKDVKTHATPRQFPNWPLDEWRLKIATADRYDRMYGKLAGQWIMPQLGFPTPPPSMIQSSKQLDLFPGSGGSFTEAAE